MRPRSWVIFAGLVADSIEEYPAEKVWVPSRCRALHGSVAMVALLKMPNRINAEADERRNFPRKESSTLVEGHRVDHSVPARQQPHLTLQLRDLSLGGLSAISPAPMEQGERVVVVFPRQGLAGGWDALGRVLRCEPSALGYRIAMEFDDLPAA